MLILNVAHDLLKDVLDGGKAGRPAIFVHGDGDMVLAGPEFLKQLAHDLGFGYKKGRTHDFVHRSMVLGRINEGG